MLIGKLGNRNQATARVGAVSDWKKSQADGTLDSCVPRSPVLLPIRYRADPPTPRLGLSFSSAASVVLHDLWLVAVECIHPLQPTVACLELPPYPFPGSAARFACSSLELLKAEDIFTW